MADRSVFNNFKSRARKFLGLPPTYIPTKKERVGKTIIGGHYRSTSGGGYSYHPEVIVNGYLRRAKKLQSLPKILGTVKGGKIRVLDIHGIRIYKPTDLHQYKMMLENRAKKEEEMKRRKAS
jgi:hypothetical protein